MNAIEHNKAVNLLVKQNYALELKQLERQKEILQQSVCQEHNVEQKVNEMRVVNQRSIERSHSNNPTKGSKVDMLA